MTIHAREALADYRAVAKPATPAGKVLILDRPGYRIKETARLVAALRDAGWLVDRMPLPANSAEVMARVPQFPYQPAAVLRWEEHGCLFANLDWQRSVRHLYAQGIVPLSADYGYFDHQHTIILDIYLPDGRRSIWHDWGRLPAGDPWATADPRLVEYRDNLLAERDRALTEPPLEAKPYGVIWPQQSAFLARRPFAAKNADAWIAGAAKMLAKAGLTPVVKASPIGNPAVSPGVKVYGAKGNWDRHLNVRLAVHAASNVILCSSVSNELALLGAPVTALGNSWFSGLGVFHEPGSWDEPVAHAEDVDQAARDRWCAWWLSRQCYAEDAPRVVADLLRRGRRLMAPPATAPGVGARERDVLFVTFHTDDPYYREQVRPLVTSLEARALPYKVYVEKNTGDWKRNTWLKPKIIRKALLEHPGARIVFLDSDAEVVEDPGLFRRLDADFAAHWRFGWMLLSGTLMFDSTPSALELVDTWEDHLHLALKGDQDALGMAIHLAARQGLRAANLPASYTAIDKLMPVPRAVIRHRMAHREGKGAVRRA